MTNLIYRDGFYVNTSRPQHLTMNEVENEIVKVSGYSATLLKSRTRKAEIRVWRQIGMYIMWRQGIGSLSEIGMYWGNREHTTVMSARDRIQDLIDCNDHFVTLKLNQLQWLYNRNSSNHNLNYSAKKYATKTAKA